LVARHALEQSDRHAWCRRCHIVAATQLQIYAVEFQPRCPHFSINDVWTRDHDVDTEEEIALCRSMASQISPGCSFKVSFTFLGGGCSALGASNHIIGRRYKATQDCALVAIHDLRNCAMGNDVERSANAATHHHRGFHRYAHSWKCSGRFDGWYVLIPEQKI
jgi:hypothetical protein